MVHRRASCRRRGEGERRARAARGRGGVRALSCSSFSSASPFGAALFERAWAAETCARASADVPASTPVAVVASRSPLVVARRSSSCASLLEISLVGSSSRCVRLSTLSRCFPAVLTSLALVPAASSSSLVVGRRSSSSGPAFLVIRSVRPALRLSLCMDNELTPLLLAASSSSCRPASSTTSSS